MGDDAQTWSTTEIRTVAPRCLVLALATALFAWWCYYSWDYIEDDAYIHLEFAKSVANGNGFRFDGRAVYGDSSPLWVLVLAGLQTLGVPLTLSAKLLCILGLFACVVALLRLLDVVIRDDSLRVLTAIGVMTGPFVLHWAFSGMEVLTSLATGLLLIYFVHVPSTKKSALLLRFLALSVAPLLRFEFLFLVPLTALSLLSGNAAAQVSMRCRRALALVVALPFLCWTGFAGYQLGTYVPTTTAAKRVADLGLLHGALHATVRIVSTFGFAFGVGAVIGGAFLLIRWKDLRALVLSSAWSSARPRGHLLSIAWPCTVLAFYVANRTAVQTRYALILGPPLIIAVVAFIERVGTIRQARSLPAAMLLGNIVAFSFTVEPHVRNKIQLVHSTHAFVKRIVSEVGPREPIAVFAIGQFALEMDNPIIDTGGIMFPSVIPFMRDATKTAAWAEVQGARCIVNSSSPSANYELRVTSGEMPVVGFHFGRRYYDGRFRLNLYCTKSSGPADGGHRGNSW